MSKIERFLSDPRYQALDDAGKKEKLDLFFNKYVTQDARYSPLDEEGKARVYSNFMRKYYGEPEAKAPKQETPFSGLKSELKGTMSLTQSAVADKTSTDAVESYMAKAHRESAEIGYSRGAASVADERKPKNIFEAMDVGFTQGLTSVLSAPQMISDIIQGDIYSANYTQGMIDQRLKDAGYDDMDMASAIKNKDIKKAGGMALKVFSQSAPVTALWLVHPIIGDVFGALMPTAASKYTQLDREMPELSTGKKVASAALAGTWEALSEEIGNRLAFMNKFVKIGRPNLAKLIAKEVGKTKIVNAFAGGAMGAVGEGFEEYLSFNGEYWTDVMLGITDHDPKAYREGAINSTLLGISAGGVQGGITTTVSSLLNARYSDIQGKLDKAASIDLSRYNGTDRWNAAKNAKMLAQKTQAAVQFAREGDTEGAIQLAKENLSAAQRILDKEQSSAIKTIGMYNALLIDTATQYQEREEGLPVPSGVGAGEQATAIQEPTQQAAATEPQSVEDTIVNLVQEGNIEAAENALNEAVKNRVTGINVPYLRNLVNESKADAERIAKEEADQKARRDIIDKYGEYADMSHSELQDEAKKRGLKAGGKSTDIMARLKESDEKPKAETTPAKPAAKKPFTTNEPTEQQQDRAIKESLIAEEAPKKASKYESMGYNAVQKEAKKRGINSFGVKKADLIRQIEEKDADTDKTNAKKASVYDNSAEIEGIVVGKSADEIKSALSAKLTELKKQGYTSFMFRGKEFSVQGHLDILARQAKDRAKEDKFLNSKSYKDFIDRTNQQNKAYKDMLAKAERKEPLTIAEAEGFATGVPKGYIKDGHMYIHKDSASAKVESVEPYSNRSKMNREALRNEKKGRLRSLEEMKARGVKSVKIGAKQMTIDKAIDVTRKSMGISLLDEYNAEQRVSPTLSEDVKWKIYKARKQFERYVEAPLAYRISKKELDNALRKLNALESEYGLPNTMEDGTRGGYAYEQKDATPIEYTGKSDGKIDRNLVDAIKSGEAWLYNQPASEEWNIAIAEMKEEGSLWWIKDQDIIDQGTKIMEEIDELLDEIDNIENTTENREKIKEIEAKIRVLQEKHIDLWDEAKSDQASQAPAPVKAAEDSKAEGVDADASVERAKPDTKPEPQKTKAAPAPDQFADTSKMIEAEISKRDGEAQRRNIDKAIADGYDTLDATSADLRGSWYLTKKGKKNDTPMVWVSKQNLKYAENALANKPEAKEDVVKPEAELNVLKKELADIYRTLSLLKEEYDRLLKIAPDDRTAEQDKRIEYIDDLSKIRTIRKSEIETEIAGYESQKSDKMMPKQQTADPVKAAEDSKAEGVEKARAAIKENNITPDAKTRVLVTESGSPFAIIQLLDSDARMYGTHEVLAWIETNEKPYAMNQTYTEWFKQRVDKRLISAVSKEVTKETSGLGFLQTQTADAKYIKGYADYVGQVPSPVKAAEDIESEVMSRSNFQEQYRQAQEGKLPKGQIDAQLKLYDAMMDTYAKEMGITIDEAYAQTIESVTDQEAGQPTPSEVAKEESGMRTQVDESYAPKKTKIAYKLFRTLKSRPGEIFPLFIGKSEATPIGQWIKAEFIPTKGFQERPGWHLGFAPYAPHLRKADGSMDESRVWYEVEIPDDVDWQTKADATKTGDIRGEVPEGGYYTFKRPGAQGGEWKIAGAIKVIRPLSLEEVNRIKAEKGINDILYQSAQETTRYQTIQGYIQKMPNGKYRIGIMQPNVTTGLHEQAHLGKSLMEIMANKSPAWASRLKAAEEWCGVKDGNWTTEAEEKFANGYVKFLADGSAPNGKLKTIFAKIKEWIGSILQGIAAVKNIDVSSEMRGVYLAMLGVSEGKRNLTSEQKVQSIKLKSAMKQDTTSDPSDLEVEIDRFANNNMLILEGKRTGNKTSFYLNRIDDGKTMIEIHHSKGEYEVNGYHAANNQEVMEQITRMLGDTRYQTTDMPSAAEIAEAERQMEEVRKQYEGTDQWMKAPNGNPTNLSERQWLQVRTQNFKDWFGDWINDPKNASKVVDENGEPRVVYHGTDAPEIYTSFRTPSFFAYNAREASAYSGDSDFNRRMRKLSRVSPAKGADKYSGTTVPYVGIFEDVPHNERGKVWATDEGVGYIHQNGKIDMFTDLVIADNVYSWDTATVVRGESGAYERWQQDYKEWSNDLSSREDGSGRVYPAFLNIRNPKQLHALSANVIGERLGMLEKGMKEVDIAKKEGHDGVFTVSDDIGSWDEEERRQAVPFYPAQIKSAAANVGTFSEGNDIRYQIDNAIQSASPDMQDRIAKIMEKQKKVQQAANVTYRELAARIGRTTSVYEWDSLMRKSLVTAIRKAFPGAAPMNIEKYAALEETLGELDPGLDDHAKEIKRIKAQLRRMVAMDKKFREALEDVSGFSDIADIPFEGLFSALENTNPSAYDRYFRDETFEILLKALPRIKKSFGEQFTMQTLQRIVDVTLNGSDPAVGRAEFELAFVQPHRVLAELFGKAGIKTINYAYNGTLAVAAYENEYAQHLAEINRLLMTADNNRGSAYEGDDLDIIGRTIFEVDGNSEITDKLETIQARLAEWAENNNAIINPNDVDGIYKEKEYLKDIMRGFIAEWNANPEHERKIGIREDYDNPRKYNWGTASDITTKRGKYLYTPGNARARSKQDFSEGLNYETNIFSAYSNYMYAMTRYMAFYDLANYVEDSSVLYPSKGKVGQKKIASGFDLDLSLAQRKSSAYASGMLESYVKNVIGYHKKDTPMGRLVKSARTNVYSSMLAANIAMTVLNYNQRNLIHAVVDQSIAMQVKKDIAFWTGLFRPSNEEYPVLSGIMQAYVTANQSLIAELSAEAKRYANEGRTALTRAYYRHTAKNSELLRLSPFSLAELGNRAYAHAAGVYQITQNSEAYKNYTASGMSRHRAMEKALAEDSSLRRAAITYGGILNAEINADANRAFSPYFFSGASKINSLAIFIRYGVTIALLELRTYGGARDIRSLLSPDLFKLLTSGNVKAATAAQTIQAGVIMKSMLDQKRIAELVRRGDISTAKTSKNLITVEQVNMVREAITWALDEQAKHTTEEYHAIIRGKRGARQAMAALMAFSISEVILRSAIELLFSLIPWWLGKKKFIETDVIENVAAVFGLFQTTKTMANVRLGSTLAPDLGAYNPTAKTTTKALSQYVLRLTPYAGLANYMGKVFTGKYFSDIFWDEVYD